MIQAQINLLTSPLIANLRPRARQAASDEALIGRIAAGDAHAFQALVARYNVRVFRFVLGKVKDQTLADDLVGEIFFEVWKHAHQFAARAAVSTWLLGIARHKALCALRRLRVHEKLDDALAIEDPSQSPEVTAQKKDRDEVLRGCLMKLSHGHREILDLVYYHEQPMDSAAKFVGIPLNTVKTRMFYAKKHLAALLVEAGVDRSAL
jgi:RNA polymerase sigma-70 factor, ECF subfamily